MYPNFSFFGHSALCYLTCGTALAYPALSGSSAEGFFGFEHESSQGDLFEVYNRGQLLNQKRPLESQPASSQSLMEAHGTNVGDYHSYEEAEYPMNTLMPLPNGQKRQKAGSGAYDGPSSMSGFASTYAASYQPFFPPDLRDGVQVNVDNVSLHPGGFPEETHENPNHERLVFEKEETNYPSLREDAEGNSIVNNPETDRLSRVDMELGSTDPKWHISRHQLESNSFSDKCVAGGGHIGSLNHAKTPDIFQFPVSSTGKGLFTPGSLQNVTPTTIAHEAENLCALHGLKESRNRFKPQDVNRIKNQNTKTQAGVNIIPMASEEEIERCLMKIRFPTRKIDMSDQFLEGFIERFRRKIVEVYKFSSNRWVNLSLPCKSITRISQRKSPQVYVIRVLYDSQPHVETQEGTRAQGSTRILPMFVKLIELLLLVNKLVLINMVKRNMSYQDQYKLHKKLVDWLFDQAFHPEGLILPVLGFTPDIRGKDFGPIQEILSSYLSQTLTSSKALDTSISIIRYYYQNVQNEGLKGIGNIDENQIFERNLKRLIYHGLQSGFVVDDPILRPENISSKFGNFRIPPLTFFPDTMRPRDPRILYKVNFNKDEEHILNYLFSFLKRCRTNHKYKNLELENIPVSLKKLVYKEERNSSEGDVLVTVSKKFVSKKRGLIHKSERLMVYLKACHIGLKEQSHKNESFKQGVNEQMFYKWFYDLLFTQKENLLPIFGSFVVKDRNYFKDPPIPSDYSDIQTSLINYFAGILPDESVIRLSLSLIGYFNWFKDQDHSKPENSLQDADSYWKNVVMILEAKFSNRGVHTLRHFFPELRASRAHVL
ncbi:hypothetical protein PSTG_15993 [Puccinia striiformis f. sp. tritici PST-78]|uniref:Uncharacterized protein n=1 Tax=Puccinia striiformis f. sp. tritici PST-78 TaxID=1165861 RepID=A0A0L0UV04_9BASI|nr:hypothetical protein PSTG_15993 [Puccinia striiformis f. sp. tritici PST-78]